MAHRITTAMIKSIKVEDKKTWPVDLDVWVELSIRHTWKTWDAPFYLNPTEYKKFIKVIKQEQLKKTTRSHRRTSGYVSG